MPLYCPDNSGMLSGCYRKQCPDSSEICTNFVLQYNEEIMRIMNDLYKDPANVLISNDFMCRTAYSKLKGEDVEELIQLGRILADLIGPGF